MQSVSSEQRKVGLVLLNMGGPIDLDAVRPFLYNLFKDPDIINLPFILKPFQKPLAWMIAKFRTSGTKDMYRQIGGGSPILEITENLSQKVAMYLGKINENIDYIPSVAMRYTEPRAEQIIETFKDEGITELILFSQYPHYADSTTGSSLNEFYEVMDKLDYQPKKIIEIDEWGTEDEYIDWWVKGVEKKLAELEIELDEDVHLIFSAHGLPKRYVDQGEQYPDRIQEAAQLVISRLEDSIDSITTHISFQSQAGPIEWTKPYTDELLKELAAEGAKAVIIVPLGFVSNHVETLFEIDILYKEEALEAGIPIYESVPVPDSDETYAENMAEMINRKMEVK